MLVDVFAGQRSKGEQFKMEETVRRKTQLRKV